MLSWTNYVEFKRVLYTYAVRYGTFVVGTINDFADLGPPDQPDNIANQAMLQQYNKNEKAYEKYLRDCAYLCSILYNSLSTDIRIRVDSDPVAFRSMGFGKLGALWRSISEIVRESGQNSVMPTFAKMLVHKCTDKRTWRQDIEQLISMFKTIYAQYPTAPDKERLWNEFESFAVVTSLSGISEFENHFQQHVYPLKQWPTGPQIMASITNYADSMLKLQKDNNHGEVQANSASSDARAYAMGPCFNCGGTHLSRECKKEPNKCYKCGRSGHMAEYCDRVQSHNSNWQDKKKENSQFKNYPNSTYPNSTNKTSSKFQNRSSQSFNPKSKSKTFRYKHDKSKRHKKTLARLIIATDEDEPDLNKVYLSQLLSSPGDWVEFYEDELCRSEDAVEDDIDEYNPDDDEVYYAPEIDRIDAQSAYDDNQEFTRTSYSRGHNTSSNWPQQSSTTSTFFSQNFQNSTPSSPALSAVPTTTTKSFNRNDMYISQPSTPSNNVNSFSQIDQPFSIQLNLF
jgi:hypothetical protein